MPIVGAVVFPSTTVWGRGDVAGLWANIGTAANALRLDIGPHMHEWREGEGATEESRRFVEDWHAFYREFSHAHQEYLRDPILVPVATGSTVVETARGYAERFNALEERARSLGVRPTVATRPAPVAPREAASWETTVRWVAGAIIVGAVVYGVTRVL